MEKRKPAFAHTYIVGTRPPITFIGREPVEVSDPKHRRELIKMTGVIEDMGGGLLRYMGKVTLKKKDGTKQKK